MNNRNNSKKIAAEIKEMADKLGWNILVRGHVLTITKDILPNSNESFTEADMEYHSILSLLPRTNPGSTWGTDGGGIGAISAMRSGQFVMNKSGGNKNVLKHLSKI